MTLRDCIIALLVASAYAAWLLFGMLPLNGGTQ